MRGTTNFFQKERERERGRETESWESSLGYGEVFNREILSDKSLLFLVLFNSIILVLRIDWKNLLQSSMTFADA